MQEEYVRLTERDLEQLIDACELVCEYKQQVLKSENWLRFEQEYLPSLVVSLRNNQFKVVDTHNNIFIWIRDQIIHSRRVLDQVPRRDWLPLTDLDWVEDVLGALRHASRGQVSYDTHRRQQQYLNLFQ